MTKAARALIQKCVIEGGGIGGRAYYIGKQYNCAKSLSVAFPDETSEMFDAI